MGLVVAGAIILLWNRADRFEKLTVFNNLDQTVSTDNASDNIVNQLLLSANELNIYGKSSLIEYSVNSTTPSDEILLEQIKINPDNAYKKILKNKLDKLKQQPSTSDFNVKSVPK